IVSSDSDFTPLVMHLKAKGSQVYGFGAQKTPMPFVNACTRFLYVETLGDGGEDALPEEAPAAAAKTARKRSAPAKEAKAAAPAAEAAPNGGVPDSAGHAPALK